MIKNSKAYKMMLKWSTGLNTLSRMELCTKVNSSGITVRLDMGLELRSGLMVLNTRANGHTIKQMVEGHFNMFMATNMKGIGLMIKLRVMGFTLMRMAQDMRANGRMIYSMDGA